MLSIIRSLYMTNTEIEQQAAVTFTSSRDGFSRLYVISYGPNAEEYHFENWILV